MSHGAVQKGRGVQQPQPEETPGEVLSVLSLHVLLPLLRHRLQFAIEQQLGLLSRTHLQESRLLSWSILETGTLSRSECAAVAAFIRTEQT